jgi:hypothetical protein
VRIHWTVLPGGQRAPGVPSDTAAAPYDAWVNGWALEAAQLGDTVAIETLAGRCVRGTLVEVSPGYSHSFGRPHPVMLAATRAWRRYWATER